MPKEDTVTDRFDKDKDHQKKRQDDLNRHDRDADERLDREAEERQMTDYDREDVDFTRESDMDRLDRDRMSDAEHGEGGAQGDRGPAVEGDEVLLPNLVSLSENPVTLEDPAADVRGHDVLDRDGESIGKVSDLLVDERERRVRFLNVKSGGFLGIGADTHVIPVDAITRVEEGEVHIDQSRDHVGGSPPLDPDVNLDARETYEGIYRHYGYTPFWMPGYAYPRDPFERRR